ncbi:hypothetical protein [Halococcus salsus]|uniref:hypothetical protein n=1 Tax=Halococcus salsus TaxID=2162894 RepID=UPI00135A97AB|nr:hypothetical protein [Halococcus salsus]
MNIENTDNSRLWRIGAIIGLLSLTASVYTARYASIDGYEISIYTGTPLVAWIGFGIALFTAIGLCFRSDYRLAQWTGAGLIIAVVFSFTALPLIRGYYFFASSDTFAQLGVIRDLIAGYGIPETILYPAPHLLATKITLITGLPIETSTMLLIPIFSILFCVFVELTSRRITPAQHQVGAGLVVGSTLPPIMTVQLPNLQMTPLVLAVFYVSFLFYLLNMYLLYSNRSRTIFVLFISLPTLVFLHPLVGVAVAAFFAGTAIVRFVFSIFRPTLTFPSSRRILVGAGGVLGLIVYLQTFSNPTFQGAIGSLILQIQNGISTTGGVANRTNGLSKIGASIWEILLKIFAAKIIIVLLASGSIIYSFKNIKMGKNTKSASLLSMYAVALVPIGGLMIVTFAAGRVNLVTRFIGVTFVILSVFATTGISIIRAKKWNTKSRAISLWIVLFIVIAVASPALFTSPYLYQDSPHVTDREHTGYATLFKYRAEDVSIGTTRSLVYRHRTSQLGRRAARGNGYRLPNNEMLANIENKRPNPSFFPYHFNGEYPSENVVNDTYLVLPESDVTVDTELYDGLRYTRDDYNRLRNDPGGTHIYSNGGFDTHFLSGNGSVQKE